MRPSDLTSINYPDLQRENMFYQQKLFLETNLQSYFNVEKSIKIYFGQARSRKSL